MEFVKLHLKEHGKRIIHKGYEIYYTDDSIKERVALVSNSIVKVKDTTYGTYGYFEGLFDFLIEQYENDLYQTNTEKRLNETIENFKKGCIGVPALETLKQLKADLKKEIDKLLNEGEVQVIIKYELSIISNKIKDNIIVEIVHCNTEEDHVYLTFDIDSSINMIYKHNFIKVVSELLNKSVGKSKEDYLSCFEDILNGEISPIMTKLIDVSI